jgi:hypothetical protein
MNEKERIICEMLAGIEGPINLVNIAGYLGCRGRVPLEPGEEMSVAFDDGTRYTIRREVPATAPNAS